MEDKYNDQPIMEINIQVKYKGDGFVKSLRIFEQKFNSYINLEDNNRKPLKLSEDGVYISDRLSKTEDISVGQEVKVRFFGTEKWYKTKIIGTYRQPINQGFVMSKQAFEKM